MNFVLLSGSGSHVTFLGRLGRTSLLRDARGKWACLLCSRARSWGVFLVTLYNITAAL